MAGQFQGVRVPWSWVIPLVLAVMAGTWWQGTRKMDFMTPPSESTLAAILKRVETSLPAVSSADAIASRPAKETPPEPEIPAAPEPPPPPPVELGDRSSIPGLSAYQETAPEGAAHLIEMASLLEADGDFQRALLVWERVLDATTADTAQTAAAITAVKRLRPTLPDWNVDPEGAAAIVLHAGTGKNFAATLRPVVDEVARDLEKVSSGILKVTPEIDAGASKVSGDKPAAVAIWLGGTGEKAPATEVVSFTAGSPESLRGELLQTVFKLVRLQLEASKSLVPPAPMIAGENPREALEFRVTRRAWEILGKGLQPANP